MFLQLVVLFLALNGYFCIPLNETTDCGSTATIVSVSMTGCPHTPCQMQGGHNYTGQTVFVPRHSHKEAHFMVSGVIAGKDIPVKPRENLCGNGLNCPLQPGQEYTISVTYDMPAYANFSQPTSIAGKYYVKDENDRNIVCVVLPIMFH